jgi:CheY-like chemotaxis protein/anti-sigma regulatory factor (Ser/Thr protein kinase)
MAILNLAVNARDAMPDGGALAITGSAESGASGEPLVQLSIRDTGTGMDEDTLARAVEPFFSTKGLGQGTGLGLSMVHGLVAQLGGELKIKSEVGIGTTVEMWLPVASEAASQADRPKETEPAKAAGVALLVDDEELIRLSTADMLGELGYAVLEAASGEEAMKMIDKGARFDLLVTDHLMPGLTGSDLARTVRQRWPGMPILIISGYANVDGVAPDLARLAKPFRKSDLAAKIAGLVPG